MIRLDPMTADEFARYLEAAIPAYAQAHVKAGDCEPQDALAWSKSDYEELLPDGLATDRNHLCTIRALESAAPVGMIWWVERERRGRKSAYIYDIMVDEPLRGKGYGAETLRTLETLLAAKGIGRVSLNVMGWNHRAQALYERMGFHVTGIGMTKTL